MVPVDANLVTERQVEYDCVKADRVLAFMESSTETNIIILDACRNNPFERSWNRSSGGNGLAFMDAPSGTLIAYATAPGSTASDGTGKNGLYTEALVSSIKIPNISALEMFQNVRKTVAEKSNDQQIPWESTSLTGEFYFLHDGTVPQASDQASSNLDFDQVPPGTSTVDINGHKLTYKKYGNKKPIYLGWPRDIYIQDRALTTSDILDILSGAEHPMYDVYRDYYRIRLAGATLYYSSIIFIPVGGIGSLVSEDEEWVKQFNVLLYTGAGMFITGMVLNRISNKKRDQFLKYTFPDSFANVHFGITPSGIGIAYNF